MMEKVKSFAKKFFKDYLKILKGLVKMPMYWVLISFFILLSLSIDNLVLALFRAFVLYAVIIPASITAIVPLLRKDEKAKKDASKE